MEHLIELKDVYKIYHMGDEAVHALDGVSLTIDKGEFVAIVGQSGSGKSTAMNIIGCLDVPTSGTYHLGGVDVSTMDDDQQAEIRNKMLGFIFQQYNLIPKLTVLENVELPLLYAGVGAEERKERAVAALGRVGLADKQKNLPSQLSGGQQQRVSIARALAGNPSVILADEPTGALDSRTGREVLGFLQKLNQEGDTVVLITHDNSIAVKAKRIVRLQDGRIIYDGDASDPAAVVPPMVMTGGGPDHSTYTLVYDIYETGTMNWEMGLASTMAIVFTIFVVILTIIQNVLTKGKEEKKHVNNKAKNI